MRLRHIPGAEEIIAASPHVIQNPKEKRGEWRRVFGNERPVQIEVGMGKGKFIMKMAGNYPEINFIGIERYSTVLLKGLQKREQLELENIYFLCIDAKELPEIFALGEVQKIYLNFSDPWPKDRHAKRRLTSRQFMEVYDKILTRDGIVEFKTDNRGLFEFSLESIPAAGWEVIYSTFDLHHSQLAEGNVMTEYETKFAMEGKPICKLAARRQETKA